jgi:hypothetical protein
MGIKATSLLSCGPRLILAAETVSLWRGFTRG